MEKEEKMRKIFICSPYRGDVDENVEKAKKYCRNIIDWYSWAGELAVPIAPHLYFPQILDDENEDNRRLGIKMGLELMKNCDVVLVFGDTVTEGMKQEIEFAQIIGLPVEYLVVSGNQ